MVALIKESWLPFVGFTWVFFLICTAIASSHSPLITSTLLSSESLLLLVNVTVFWTRYTFDFTLKKWSLLVRHETEVKTVRLGKSDLTFTSSDKSPQRKQEQNVRPQRRIQNPVKHLRWSFLLKYLTAFSHLLLWRMVNNAEVFLEGLIGNASLALRDSVEPICEKTRNRARFQLAPYQNFCPTAPPLTARQLKHPL